ncbi:hypothetical protein [Solimonas aquatica]|nr:hypothetical protein [Solimonas aquatica]
MIKALSEVVLPAVDAGNQLAQEQTRLTIGMLNLMAQQLPLQFRFDCDELARLLEFSRQLCEQTQGGPGCEAARAELAQGSEHAAEVLQRAAAGPSQVEQAVRELRRLSGVLIGVCSSAMNLEGQDRVARLVLAMSKAQLLRDRAWLLPQGWEPDPQALPPITELLRDTKP